MTNVPSQILTTNQKMIVTLLWLHKEKMLTLTLFFKSWKHHFQGMMTIGRSLTSEMFLVELRGILNMFKVLCHHLLRVEGRVLGTFLRVAEQRVILWNYSLLMTFSEDLWIIRTPTIVIVKTVIGKLKIKTSQYQNWRNTLQSSCIWASNAYLIGNFIGIKRVFFSQHSFHLVSHAIVSTQFHLLYTLLIPVNYQRQKSSERRRKMASGPSKIYCRRWVLISDTIIYVGKKLTLMRCASTLKVVTDASATIQTSLTSDILKFTA